MRTTEGGLVTGRRAGAAGSRRHVRRRSLLHLAVAALVLAWALLLLTPLTVAAAELRQGETVVVTPTEVVDDDLYAFGQTITIHGTVTGDVIAAGQTVTISGPVEGDVLVAASQVTITGPVAGTIRTAGQVVELTATVGGDVLVAGAAVTTTPRAEIGRDLLLGASNATIGGGVGRSIRAGAETLTIAAPVGGDVLAQVGTLRLASGTDVQGSLTYTSAQEAIVDPGALVQGMTTRLEQSPAQPRPSPAAQVGEAVIGWLRSLVGLGAFGLLVVLLFPGFSARTTATLSAQPWPSVGLGFAALVGAPAAALLLFIVGLLIGGWWLGLLLLATLLALVPLGYAVVGLYIGQWLMQRIGRPHVSAAWSVLTGLVVLGVVSVAPILGGVVLFVSLLFGLGAAILTLGERYRGTSVPESTPTAPLHDFGEPIPAR
jgi:cytoskeletal protein CcmA (bactofilin family)